MPRILARREVPGGRGRRRDLRLVARGRGSGDPDRHPRGRRVRARLRPARRAARVGRRGRLRLRLVPRRSPDCSAEDDTCNIGLCNEGDRFLCALASRRRSLLRGWPLLHGRGDLSRRCLHLDSVRVCTAEAGACVVDGSCDEANNRCLGEPLEDGTDCNDYNACSTASSCEEGHCVNPVIMECGELDGACETGICDPGLGECTTSNRPDDEVCDDGSPCTLADACSAGACIGASMDCSDLDGICSAGTCNEESGACEERPAPRRQRVR